MLVHNITTQYIITWLKQLQFSSVLPRYESLHRKANVAEREQPKS